MLENTVDSEQFLKAKVLQASRSITADQHSTLLCFRVGQQMSLYYR